MWAMTHWCGVTWLIHMCDVTDTYRICHAKSTCRQQNTKVHTKRHRVIESDVTLSYVWTPHFYLWHDSLYLCHDSLTCWDMTHSYVWHDVHKIEFICRQQTIKRHAKRDRVIESDMPHSSWHASLICVTWLIGMCDMAHWCVVTWLVHTFDKTHSYQIYLRR